MPFDIPSFPDPQNSAVPIAGAYGYTAGIILDLSLKNGSAVLNVHRSAASAAARDVPVSQIQIAFGQVVVQADPKSTPPTDAVVLDTVDQFLAEPVDQAALAAFNASPSVGTAWNMILAALDHQWAKHPRISGSTIV